jgi:hypothetical protein
MQSEKRPLTLPHCHVFDQRSMNRLLPSCIYFAFKRTHKRVSELVRDLLGPIFIGRPLHITAQPFYHLRIVGPIRSSPFATEPGPSVYFVL